MYHILSICCCFNLLLFMMGNWNFFFFFPKQTTQNWVGKYKLKLTPKLNTYLCLMEINFLKKKPIFCCCFNVLSHQNDIPQCATIIHRSVRSVRNVVNNTCLITENMFFLLIMDSRFFSMLEERVEDNFLLLFQNFVSALSGDSVTFWID